MTGILTRLVFIAVLAAASADATEGPARGKLLVATEVIRGDIFVQTVVLLLHYRQHSRHYTNFVPSG